MEVLQLPTHSSSVVRFLLLWTLKRESFASPRHELNCPSPLSCPWGFLLLALTSVPFSPVVLLARVFGLAMQQAQPGWKCLQLWRSRCPHVWLAQLEPPAVRASRQGKKGRGKQGPFRNHGCQLSEFLSKGTRQRYFFLMPLVFVYHCFLCKQWLLRSYLLFLQCFPALFFS